jgi:hypothetical protein
VIDREMFEEWLAHPVTEHVLKVVGGMADKNKQLWIEKSWDGGLCDPVVLVDLKARYEIAKDLSELKFEDIENEE